MVWHSLYCVKVASLKESAVKVLVKTWNLREFVENLRNLSSMVVKRHVREIFVDEELNDKTVCGISLKNLI